MFKRASLLGGSDELGSEEIARLIALTKDLADDYGVPELPDEFSKVADKGGTTERFWAELGTAAQIATFVYEIGRDLAPVVRKWMSAGGQEQAGVEAEAIRKADEEFVGPTDSPALSTKKKGLIRRVVRALLQKG